MNTDTELRTPVEKPEAPDVRSAGASGCAGTPSGELEMTVANRALDAVSDPGPPTLVVGLESRQWRRMLGPLAWAALEDLALVARQYEQGWAAPVGVRDLAAAMGVTKDTAARAISALASAGLVTRTRVETDNKRRRSGYRLRLPDGIERRTCPPAQDSHSSELDCCPDGQDNRSPDPPDTARCPADHYDETAETRDASTARHPPGRPSRSRRRVSTTVEDSAQPRLFSLPSPIRRTGSRDLGTEEASQRPRLPNGQN